MQSSEGSPSCNHYYLRLRCKLSRIECTNLQQSNAKMRHCGFSSKPILLYANGDNIRLETEKPYDAEEVSQFKSNALSKSDDTVLVSAGAPSYLHNLFQIWQPALSCNGIFGKNVWCFSIWFTKVTSFDGFRCWVGFVCPVCTNCCELSRLQICLSQTVQFLALTKCCKG